MPARVETTGPGANGPRRSGSDLSVACDGGHCVTRLGERCHATSVQFQLAAAAAFALDACKCEGTEGPGGGAGAGVNAATV